MIKTKKKILISFILTAILCVCALILLGGASSASAATSVEKPKRDSTYFVYNGEEQTYFVEESEYYTVSNNVRTDDGTQYVIISLKDKENCTWSDGTTEDISYAFTIYKKRYSMNDVKFNNKTVVYDGKEHSLAIEGTLPEGITVSYSANNLQTEPGEYQITANFSGEDENYEKISPLFAKLIIRQASVSSSLDKNGEYTVTATSPIGIMPGFGLTISEKDYSKSAALADLLGDNDKLYMTYDIKLTKNDVAKQPDTEVEITIKLPSEIAGKNIRIINFKPTGEIEELEVTKGKGGTISFKTNDLYDLALIYDDTPMFLWLWVALFGSAAILVGGVIFVMMIRAGKKNADNEKTKDEKPAKEKKK